MHKRKSQRITVVITIHPLETMILLFFILIIQNLLKYFSVDQSDGAINQMTNIAILSMHAASMSKDIASQ